MRNVASVLLLLLCLLPLQADSNILANSNFANGKANWQGDAKELDSDITTMNPNSQGVIIHLKKDKWTKIYQLFTVRTDKLYYTVTFQLSNDFKLNAEKSGDFVQADLGNIPGMEFQGYMSDNYFNLLIRGGDNYSRASLCPDMSKLGQSQTISGHLSIYNKGVESCFIIVFPPGEGSVTLTNASLSNSDPNADQ